MYRASTTTSAALENSYELFEGLPTFWKDLSDADKLKAQKLGELYLNTDIYEYAEAIRRSNSIATIEPTMYQQWYRLEIHESELASTNIVKYGSGYLYGSSLVYGQLQTTQYSFATELVSVGLICDNIVAPTVILDPGQVIVDSGVITFLVNPFDVFPSSRDAKGRYLQLWCRNVELNKKLPFYKYGSILGQKSAATAQYTGAVQALWDLMVNGPSLRAVSRGLYAAVGLPYIDSTETVIDIATDSFYKLIITDRNVYRFHASATPLVTIGQVCVPGQNLVDTIQIYDLSAGYAAAVANGLNTIKSLSVSPNTCAVPGDIGFENRSTSWTYERYGSGFSVRLPLSAEPATLSTFWAAAEARGGMGPLLGMTAPSQTISVNPLQFLIENCIGNNTVLIIVKPQHFLASETSYFDRLLPFLPKQTLYIFRQELSTVSDTADLTTYTETVSVIPAVGAPQEVIAPTGTTLTFNDATPLVTVS